MYRSITKISRKKQQRTIREKAKMFNQILKYFNLQLEKEIITIQESQSTEQIYSEQLLKSRDDIKKLENQLEVVQKRCGEAMSENTNLRGSIDHLLLER